MNRFEFLVNGQSVGELDYSIRDDTIVLIHTEIDPSHRAGGMGVELVKGALNLIRAETDYRVIASCTFASGWVSEHPGYEDLLTR